MTSFDALSLLGLLVATAAFVFFLRRLQQRPSAPALPAAQAGPSVPPPMKPDGEAASDALTVFFASQKGHGRRFADRLVASAHTRGIDALAVDLSSADPDRHVLEP